MSRRLLAVVVVLALGSGPGRVRAQATPTVDELMKRAAAGTLDDAQALQAATPSLPSVALAGPIDPATYRLGPGDRLVVQWSGRVTRAEYVDVGPAGDVFLSEIGGMSVAGQTLAAARPAILDRRHRNTKDLPL